MLFLELLSASVEILRSLVAASLATLWLVWRVKQICRGIGREERRNVILYEDPTWLGSWISSMRYLRNAPEILLKNYSTGVPYAVPTPEAYYVHVSSETHVRELSEAPEDRLSLHAISKDMLQPKYTMAGLEVKDQMSANGSLHSRVLRVVLTSHMSTLRPMLQKVIADVMRDEITSGQMLADDWTSVHSFSMAKNVIRTTNSSVFFGSELSEDPKFLEAAMQYPEDLLFASEVVRLTPSFLKSTTGRIVTRQGRAANTLVKYLAPIVEQRLMNQTSQSSQPKQLDCIQWLIDTNSRKTPWSVEKIIQVLLGLWFASVHQLAISIVYGLVDLCDHPEYIKALRDETKDYFLMNRGEVDLNNMPFLDSFLKESARLHPSDSISIRRKVLRPFTFHDGVHVPAGDVVCVPLRAMMYDETNFANAMEFNGFRFVSEDGASNTSKLTDGDTRFPLWGLGRRACPGRYFAVDVLKMVIAHILQNYDLKMADLHVSKKRTFDWRSATIPQASATLFFRERGESKKLKR